MKDLFNAQTLKTSCRCLPEDRVFFYEECASTNDLAKAWVGENHAGGALFAAAAQTAGRGRMGKSFYSPPESGVYFTLVQIFDHSQNPVGVTCAAAVIAMRAIRKLCGIQCEIKWVNDLLYRGKKVCGILAETVACGEETALLIGVGINLRPAVFPPELAGIAGSLENETASRAALVANIAEHLFAFLQNPTSENWLEDYRRHSCVLGKRVAFWKNGAQTEAVALGIGEDGGLLVRGADGEEVLRTGEITLRLT